MKFSMLCIIVMGPLGRWSILRRAHLGRERVGMKVTLVSPFRLLASVCYGCNRVPSAAATAGMYLFSTSLNRCHSSKFHLDGQSGRKERWMRWEKQKGRGKKKDNKTLWFLRGARNKWIHLGAVVQLACIPTAADETAAAAGIWRACASIVFDTCHRGNSFSLGLPLRPLRICLLWPNNAVKINLFMWRRRCVVCQPPRTGTATVNCGHILFMGRKSPVPVVHLNKFVPMPSWVSLFFFFLSIIPYFLSWISYSS